MGTNYYHRTDICKCCNRYKEKHIGKSSMGWQFSFQGYNEDYPEIYSFKDWKRELLSEGEIFDEYGNHISLDDFIRKVESKKIEENNHYDYCKKYSKERGYDMGNDWKDEEGYSFTFAEFS